jgi:hypothetical protein
LKCTIIFTTAGFQRQRAPLTGRAGSTRRDDKTDARAACEIRVKGSARDTSSKTRRTRRAETQNKNKRKKAMKKLILMGVLSLACVLFQAACVDVHEHPTPAATTTTTTTHEVHAAY